MKSVFAALSLKNHLLKTLTHPYLADHYFRSKKQFVIPDISIQAYSKHSGGKNLQLVHPKLYYKLLEMRNKLCEMNDTPVYLIAASKSLQEMSEFLPQTKSELMKIHGFGKAKVEKFGTLFLETITAYCLEHNLTSRMFEKEMGAKTTKKKRTKKT